MKDLQRSGLTREQWSAMTLYEKFEQVVIFVLSVIIAAIVVASVWALMREVVNRLVLGAFDTLDYATFQVVFGMIFTVVIALEFKRSLLVATERSFGILQVRTIVLIALLAIARKFIILDLGETESSKIAALAGADRVEARPAAAVDLARHVHELRRPDVELRDLREVALTDDALQRGQDGGVILRRIDLRPVGIG